MNDIEYRIKKVKKAIMAAREMNFEDWIKNSDEYAYGCVGILEFIETGDDEKIKLFKIKNQLRNNKKP